MGYYDAVLKTYFGSLNMPINVFGNSSSLQDIGNKNDTSLFVRKPYLRTNYFETNFEENIDMRSH